MAKLTNPITLSEHFALNPEHLESLGVLDVTLAIDTNLFIDPLLLEHSQQHEIFAPTLSHFVLRSISHDSRRLHLLTELLKAIPP